MSEAGSEVELVRLNRSKTTSRIHYKLEHSVAAALEESSIIRDDTSTISSTALGSLTNSRSDVTRTDPQADGDSEVTDVEKGDRVGKDGDFIVVKKKRSEKSGRRGSRDKDGKRRHRHHHHHHHGNGHHHHHHHHHNDSGSKVKEETETHVVIEVERMSDIEESPVKEEEGKVPEPEPEADDDTLKEESDKETLKGEDEVDGMKVIAVAVLDDDDDMSPEEIEKRLRIEQLLRREDEVKQRFLLLERREREIEETEVKLQERENVYIRRSQEVDELNKEIFTIRETLEEEKRSLLHLKADDYRIMETTMKKAIAEMNRVKDNCKNHVDDLADLQFKVKDLEDEIDLRDKTILNLTERLGLTTTEMRRKEYETALPNGFLAQAESQSDLESSYAVSEGGRGSVSKGYVTESSRRILPRSSTEFTRPQSVKISSRPSSARRTSESIRRMSMRAATPSDFNRAGSIKRYTGKMSETLSEFSEPEMSNSMDMRPESSLQESARDFETRRRPLSARPATASTGASDEAAVRSKACIVM
ncbi:uncharacterized protein LOC135488505 [Lineus longissimus]|uniref:uncharacterized protein LOC135488505 n=1 Tax=Lineus longissimus TaxID=88925 RepID=UPI00315CBC33